MYHENTSLSAPCELKKVQRQYKHMHLAKVKLAKVRGHHTWAAGTTFRNQYLKWYMNSMIFLGSNECDISHMCNRI